MSTEPSRDAATNDAATSTESGDAKPAFKRAAWVRGAGASSIGIELALSICVPMIGAYYLEQHVTHWTPWTTLLGVLAGLLVAGNALRRVMRDMQRDAAETDAETDDDAPG